MDGRIVMERGGVMELVELVQANNRWERRGQVLAPWPNRVRDGHYTFDGAEHQLALSEVAKGNAIHGLVRWVGWSVAEQDAGRVSLTTTVWPQTGYPWLLRLTATYALDDDGHATRGRAAPEDAPPTARRRLAADHALDRAALAGIPAGQDHDGVALADLRHLGCLGDDCPDGHHSTSGARDTIFM